MVDGCTQVAQVASAGWNAFCWWVVRKREMMDVRRLSSQIDSNRLEMMDGCPQVGLWMSAGWVRCGRARGFGNQVNWGEILTARLGV
jgi:hypothetical protein